VEAAIPAGLSIQGAISNEKLARLLTLVRQTPAVKGESVVEVRADQAGVVVTTLAPRPRLRASGHTLFIRRYDESRVFTIAEWVSFGAERVAVEESFTDEQLLEIHRVIKRTYEVIAQPIMSISRSGDQVMVRTGVQRGPLDGSGHAMTLEEHEGSWFVVSVAAWVS